MIKNNPFQKESENLLFNYCKNIDEWPKSWVISHGDFEIGKSINDFFKKFLIDRIEKKRAKSTIKIYAKYLWVLGGELIRRINFSEEERKLLTEQLIFKYVDNSGGPLWEDARDEFEHYRYDALCKQFFRFMSNIATPF